MSITVAYNSAPESGDGPDQTRFLYQEFLQTGSAIAALIAFLNSGDRRQLAAFLHAPAEAGTQQDFTIPPQLRSIVGLAFARLASDLQDPPAEACHYYLLPSPHPSREDYQLITESGIFAIIFAFDPTTEIANPYGIRSSDNTPTDGAVLDWFENQRRNLLGGTTLPTTHSVTHIRTLIQSPVEAIRY